MGDNLFKLPSIERKKNKLNKQKEKTLVFIDENPIEIRKQILIEKHKDERENLLEKPRITFKTQFDQYIKPYNNNNNDNEKTPLLLDQPPKINLKERNDLIELRGENIEDIVGQITEIHEIMRDLNGLVMDNQPLYDNIEMHIDQTYVQTDKAVTELKTASKNQKKYRRSLCWTAVGGVGILGTIGATIGILKETGKLGNK